MALFKDNIANDKQEEVVLKGIQPRNQFMYRVFKTLRTLSIIALIIAALLFASTFVKQTANITGHPIFRHIILYCGVLALGLLLLAFIVKGLFLRKAPFDDWVFEIAQKRLGTDVIFYDRKYIYIEYDRSGKEVDKKEFVTEMSDKSIHFSYFYIKTFIDRGVIQVECKKRQPIPKMAKFKQEDDLFWNIIPVGLCINTNTQQVSPIAWYLNDQNKNPSLYPTIPSTSMLIAGGTGCFSEQTPIRMFNTLERPYDSTM